MCRNVLRVVLKEDYDCLESEGRSTTIVDLPSVLNLPWRLKKQLVNQTLAS